jgi:heptosyltransferase-2/heptosyltransferase-3
MFSCVPVVVRFGMLDDMVLLTPLLHLLHERYGQPCRVIGSGSWLESLLAGHPDVQAVLTVSNPERLYWLDATQRAAARCLRARLQGAVYVCEDLAANGTRRLLRHGGVLEDQCRYAKPDCLPRDGEHWIDRWHRFAEMTPPALALPAFHADTDKATAQRLALTVEDREDLAEWLARQGLAHAKIILLRMDSERTPNRRRGSSSGDSDRWPMANWLALVRALLADPGDFTILVCGVSSETTALRDLAASAGSPRVQVVANDLPLRRFMALCGHASAMASIDSGFAQVAAALGCPLIVLYGSREPSLWRPRSPTGSPVQVLGGPPARSRMDGVTLDEVLFAWQALRGWNRASASPNLPPGTLR